MTTIHNNDYKIWEILNLTTPTKEVLKLWFEQWSFNAIYEYAQSN